MPVDFQPVDRAAYERALPWGLSTGIDLYDCDPETIRSAAAIEAFTHRLCDLLEVKRYGPTQLVRFGADPAVYGYSLVQLIETSLVSAHFAESSHAVYLDIFSCAFYDASAAVEFAQHFFQSPRVVVHSFLRG